MSYAQNDWLAIIVLAALVYLADYGGNVILSIIRMCRKERRSDEWEDFIQ